MCPGCFSGMQHQSATPPLKRTSICCCFTLSLNLPNTPTIDVNSHSLMPDKSLSILEMSSPSKPASSFTVDPCDAVSNPDVQPSSKHGSIVTLPGQRSSLTLEFCLQQNIVPGSSLHEKGHVETYYKCFAPGPEWDMADRQASTAIRSNAQVTHQEERILAEFDWTAPYFF